MERRSEAEESVCGTEGDLSKLGLSLLPRQPLLARRSHSGQHVCVCVCELACLKTEPPPPSYLKSGKLNS